MKKLIDLVKIVSRHKLKNLDIIGYNQNSKTLLNKLYTGILDNQFKTDAEAATHLYESTPDNKNYKKLKYHLEKRLINTVFFIDANEAKFNSQEKGYIECNKNFAAVKILLGRGAKSSGIRLAESTLKITLKYEFSYLAFELSRILFSHYSIYSPDKKKKKKYKEILNEQKKNLDAELVAEEYTNELRAEFTLKKGAYSEELARKSKIFVADINNSFQEVNSKRFESLSNELLLLSFQLNSEHENVIEFSKNAVVEFRKKLNQNAVIANQLRIISSLITIKKYSEAAWYFENEKTYFSTGGAYWFITKELNLIFLFYSKNYQQALSVFLGAFRKKGFADIPLLSQESWKLYEAYMQLFIELNKIDISLESQKIPKFKMGKFLNNIPIASKDKRGLNIQILILQVVFLLRRDKIDQAINRMQVLNQYSGRYLKKDYTYRSNVFIKMLIVLIRNQMHKEAVKRKAEKYLNLLREHPIEKSKQSIGVEVVPFEDLWELIISETKNEFRFTPAKMKKVEAAFGTKRKKPATKK